MVCRMALYHRLPAPAVLERGIGDNLVAILYRGVCEHLGQTLKTILQTTDYFSRFLFILNIILEC